MSVLDSTNPREDYHWLCSPVAHEWLQRAAALEGSLPARVARLRTELSAERTHLVLEQITLREKARVKFAAAGQMFFAPRLLEQATDEVVARYKAGRFANGSQAFDLCCGLGGDLLALARRGPTVAVDREPMASLFAAANLHAVGQIGVPASAPPWPCEVRTCDVDSLDVSAAAAWHIDPDRRPTGRRTTRVELHEPGPAAIERLLAQNRNAAIKLSPAAELPEGWSDDAELEWISRGQECRQLVAWFGDLARAPGACSATVLGAAGAAPRSITGRGGDEPPRSESMGRYLFEPDAAVLAAKLEGVLAAEHGLTAISPGVAYWTGEQPIMDAAMSCFEVQESLPLHLKQLKSLLRARGIGRLEIKKRGVDHDPAALRRQLNLAGSQSATLILLPIERRVMAILAQRVTHLVANA